MLIPGFLGLFSPTQPLALAFQALAAPPSLKLFLEATLTAAEQTIQES